MLTRGGGFSPVRPAKLVVSGEGKKRKRKKKGVKVAFISTDKKNESFVRSGTRVCFFSEKFGEPGFYFPGPSQLNYSNFETAPGMA